MTRKPAQAITGEPGRHSITIPAERMPVPMIIILRSPSLFMIKPLKNLPAVMPMKNREPSPAAFSGGNPFSSAMYVDAQPIQVASWAQ